MKSICINFQVHQPVRLKKYRFFQIGKDYHYYDDFQNKYLLNRIAERCYLPMNKLLLKLIHKHGDAFKVSFSVSGTALEQFSIYQPKVIESFEELAKTDCVEFLAETYYHSLSSLISEKEFKEQLTEHALLMKKLLGYIPITFRNTEMIYSDNIARIVDEMGYDTILTEGAKHILGWKSPNFLYCNASNPRLKILMRNFKLSDDIAFRFSNTSWNEWPLTAEKYAFWLNRLPKNEEIINLFMDYETFGEHQFQETGIFEFFEALPKQILKHKGFCFTTPGEASERLQAIAPVSVDHPISWADEERDLTAWLGNDMQKDAFEKLYALEEQVKSAKNQDILKVWRNLQTSDHFYYMSTKWFSDGDVHKYFNPYENPYEAYINYMNVLSDFSIRINELNKTKENIDIINQTINTNQQIQAKMEKQKVVKKGPGRPRKYPIVEKTSNNASTRKPTRVKPIVAKFEDIMKISDNELRNFLRTLDDDVVFAALQGASDNLKDKVLSNITKKLLSKYEVFMDTNTEKYSDRKASTARKEMLKPFQKR